MQVVAVGSVALDTIRIHGAHHQELLGGSASYFGLAAAHFGPVGLVGVVGSDFPEAHLELLRSRGADLSGLERREGRTFRWETEYADDVKSRRTLRTEEGVFGGYRPRLPEAYRGAAGLFLANIDPDLQQLVLAQAGAVALIAVDTMDYWIRRNPESLSKVIAASHVLLVNDEEAAELTGKGSLPEACEVLRARGPAVVVVKKGPHGVLALGPWGWLALPGLPSTRVVDPTGAGDTFAGGLVGFLAGRDWRAREIFATALAVATALASLSVEAVGVAGLARDSGVEIRARCAQLRAMTEFEVPRGF